MDAERTALIGRTQEVARALGLFESAERLVTLVGAAGVGKSRLAQHLAGQIGRDRASEPAIHVDLRRAGSPEQVAALVGVATNAPLLAQAAMPAVDQIGMSLAARGPMLLVLDDFDHLVPHAEATVGRWLAMAAELRCLVTSRQALAIAGELRLEVHPLTSEDAVELFAARVRAISPGVAVTSAWRDAARRIVERLDCLPLAIELAAARASLLTLEEILARLDRRFDLLGIDAERRVGSVRGTLRGALEWSWSLLDEPDRRALAALAVFSGGFSVAAAAAVLGGDEVAALSQLTSLRERSLLISTAPEDDRAAGRTRLDLLESVRAMAAEKLDERGERRDVELRHAEYYLAAAENWGRAAHGPDAADALHHLRLETGNLVAAGRVSLRRQPEVSLRLALALGEALALSGPPALQLDLLEHAIAAASTLPDQGANLARALILRGDTYAVCGRRREALADLVEAARRAHQAGERSVEARALYLLGAFERDDGDFATARAHLERAAELFAALPDLAGLGAAVGSLATLYRQQGRFDAALTHYERALEHHRVGDRTAVGKVLAGLGHLAAASGLVAEAAARYESALPQLRAVGDRRTEGMVLDRQAMLALERGDPAAAVPLFDAAREQLAAIGDRRIEALVIAHRAVALAWLGRAAEAREGLAVAAQGLQRVDDVRLTATHRALSACVDLALAGSAGDPADAQALRRSAQRGSRGAADDERRLATIPAEVAYVEYLSDALRLFSRLQDAAAASAPAGAVDLIEVGPEGTWLRLPGGKTARTSRVLARLLDALVEERLARPGVAVGPETLAGRVWPGEALTPRIAAERVHSVIARLRRLGLEGVLVRQAGGYLLHPAIRCERRPAARKS